MAGAPQFFTNNSKSVQDTSLRLVGAVSDFYQLIAPNLGLMTPDERPALAGSADHPVSSYNKFV